MNALTLLRGLDGLTDSVWNGLDSALLRGTAAPRVDVVETKDHYELTAELPGFGKDDVTVQIKDGILELSAEKKVVEDQKKDEEDRWLVRERRVNTYQRSFRLPRDVNGESVEAAFRDGLLVLTLPKKEESKPRQIAIKVA